MESDSNVNRPTTPISTKCDVMGPRRKASLNDIKELYCALHDLVITSTVPLVTQNLPSPVSEVPPTTIGHGETVFGEEILSKDEKETEVRENVEEGLDTPLIFVEGPCADPVDQCEKAEEEKEQTPDEVINRTHSQITSKSSLSSRFRDATHMKFTGKPPRERTRSSVFRKLVSRKGSTQSNPETQDMNNNNSNTSNSNNHDALTRKISCPHFIAPCDPDLHGRADKSLSAPTIGDNLTSPSESDVIMTSRLNDMMASTQNKTLKYKLFSRMRSKSLYSSKWNSKKNQKRTYSGTWAEVKDNGDHTDSKEEEVTEKDADCHNNKESNNQNNMACNTKENSREDTSGSSHKDDESSNNGMNNNRNTTGDESTGNVRTEHDDDKSIKTNTDYSNINKVDENSKHKIANNVKVTESTHASKSESNRKTKLNPTKSNILGSIERLVSALHLEESPIAPRHMSQKSAECELSKIKMWFNKAAEEATRHHCKAPIPRTSTYSNEGDGGRIKTMKLYPRLQRKEVPGTDVITSHGNINHKNKNGTHPNDDINSNKINGSFLTETYNPTNVVEGEDHHFVGRRRSSSAPDPSDAERFCTSYGYQCTTFV